MSKIIMVYASMSGNTEEIALAIAEGVREEGAELEIKEVTQVTAKELEEFDGILLGSYTWGDGELPDEFLEFYDNMDGVDLTGKIAGVFGSGDHAYIHFCAAVDQLQEKVVQLGARLVQEGIKIEHSPSGAEEQLCNEFGKRFVNHLTSVEK